MKTGMYICFVMLVIADLFVTEYVIRFPFIAEGNPIMQIAMDYIPGGMWTPKLIGLLGIIVFWKRVTPNFLVALCVAMSAVVLFNCFLLVTY